MEKTTPRRHWLNVLALLFVLPAVYFTGISVLKFEWGIDGPFDTAAPILERMGAGDSPGWNINLLILSGPAIALAISVLQVLGAEWNFSKEHFQFRFTIQKRWFPLSIVIVCGMVYATFFVYMIGENCNCFNG